MQSYKENAATKPLSAEGMKWFFKHYLASEADAKNPRIAILQNSDFKGLPPATIINAEIDPLRDEGKALADKLNAAGVKATRKLYNGVTHEFFGMGAVVDEANEAMSFAVEQLK
ncbi:MAG: alpha/beta hydrolase fold domain-containing protein [Chthoniobacterales bacterium]|nr:alpha/beta hydrolase fold domain-containing protein [Chthoniobacterales bacterium]